MAAQTIGIDVTAALTQGGGIGRYTRELIRALAAADTPYAWRLFSAKPPPTLPVPQPLPTGEHIRHMPAPLDDRWLYRLWYRARLPLPVQWVTGRLDLFHSPDYVLPPTAGGIPTLLTVHDLSFVHYPDHYLPQLVAYLNKVVPWSVRRATHILADSEATRRDLVALWQTPPERITVVYAGVGEQFAPVTQLRMLKAMRTKYGLGDKPYILTVGTVQPRKNYALLVRAFARIARDWPHQLVIAGGKGWLYEDVAAEIERLELGERVRVLGFVEDADLPALYSDATLFVMPSLYEGFGIPILEAMACGVPVVASNASSLPEVVGQAGVLLDPTDEQAWAATLHRLLLDAPRRARMVGQGALQARRFSWQAAANTLLTVYDRLLNGQRAA